MRKTIVISLLLAVAVILLNPSPKLPSIDLTTLELKESTITFKGTNLDKHTYSLQGVTGPINIYQQKVESGKVTLTTPSLLYGQYMLTTKQTNYLTNHILTIKFDIPPTFVYAIKNPTQSTNHAPTNLLIALSTILSLLHLRFTFIKYSAPLLAPLLALIYPPILALYAIILILFSHIINKNNIKLPNAVKLLIAGALLTLGSLLTLTSSSYAKTNPAIDCLTEENSRCTGYQISKIITKQGLKAGLENLISRNMQEDVCHDVAHWTGRLTVGSIPAEKLLDGLLTHCQLGYLHGVAEQLGQTASDEEWEKFVASCDLLEGNALLDFCGHGIGHAALMRASGDMEKAFKYCSILKNNVTVFSCRSAVPMEKTIQWTNYSADPETLVDVIKLCDALNTNDKISCLTNIWRGNLVTRELNLKKLVKLCENHPLTIASECAYGFGYGFGGDPDGLENKTQDLPCYALSSNLVKNRCLEGYAKAASYIAFRSNQTVEQLCNIIKYDNCVAVVSDEFNRFAMHKDLFISDKTRPSINTSNT
ncbi:MAG: hypothetical protein ACKOW9_06560 [Candidatus Paceibacterota bacterium]